MNEDSGTTRAALSHYRQYQHSGLPWINRLPAHWSVRRAKHVFKPVDSRSETGEEELLSVSEHDGVIPRSQKKVTMFKAESYTGHKLCWPGDLVVNSLWAWKRGLGISRYHGIVSTAYGVYRPRPRYSAHARFFDYLLRSEIYDWEFRIRSKGVWVSRLKLTDEDFLDMPIILPPADEAKRIVEFLKVYDRLTRRYIRARQRLIALLEEQKQALIQRAVTRGLDPNVRLRASGVEWLGEIPEHWEIVLNQRIFKEKIRPHGDLPETQLSLSQKDGLIATSEMEERSLQTSTYDNWKVTIPGDIVLNRFKAHLGVFFASTLRGIVSFHYGVFAPRRELAPKYYELLYHTDPYKTVYAGQSNGMTVGLQNLSNQNFYNVKSLVPPLDEQERIVAFSEQVTMRSNDLISRTQRQIDLVREYRTRLIADVVTGKLDVRDVVLPDLPDDPDEGQNRDGMMNDQEESDDES